jgi:hypothetical protein
MTFSYCKENWIAIGEDSNGSGSLHFLITDMHIYHVGLYLSEMFIGFGLLDKGGFICLQTFQNRICKERISLPAGGFRHMVL